MIFNPALVFGITWMSLLLLYSLHLSLILTPLTSATVAVAVGTSLAFFASYVASRLVVGRRLVRFEQAHPERPKFFESRNLESKLKKVFIFWALLSMAEVAIFHGVPLIRRSINYTLFGIPSIHGFLNAIIITLSNYALYFYLRRRERKYLGFFLLCLLWPVLLLTRQMLVSMVLQALFIYFMVRGIRWRRILFVTILALALIILFGILGDVRSGGGFRKLAEPSSSYPSWLPSGFLWVYVYATASLNNTNFNISQYPDLRFGPVQFVANFLPSILKRVINVGGYDIHYQLAVPAFNVGTGIESFLLAWGYWGTLFFLFLVGFLFSLIYYRARFDPNVKWKMIVVVLIHNVVLSIFASFMTSLVFLFQCFLHYYLGTHFYVYRRPKRD